MGLLGEELAIPERYNVAPSQSAPVAVRDESLGGPVLRPIRWGLVPSWAKDTSIGNSLANARAESIASKPSFRDSFKHRRCVVPISGFYEWQSIPGRRAKQPLYFSPVDDAPWLVAGLWSSWEGKGAQGGGPLETFALITTTPNELMARFHDRMPVILDAQTAQRWLAPMGSESAEALMGFLVPYGAPMRHWPVSQDVNRPGKDDASLSQPVASSDFGSIFDQRP